jgi:pimeloyl-ACP methyl ester carboxylesterase
LCQPTASGPNAKTLQLLLHGGTYNRSYWDFPYDPARYSYVRAANAAGFSTLAIDRVGYGKSTHPISGLVTVQSSAATVHQLITAVRAGELGAMFGRIVLVGHSIGSAVTIREAGTYHDVDAVVVTGLLHHVGAAVPTVLASVERGAGLACQDQAAVRRNEAQAYTRALSLQVDVLPNFGHDLNTQLTSPTFFSLVNGWIAAH